MRLMQLKEWDQVNIINLSDLCSGSLKIFQSKQVAAECLSYHYHSIFSHERQMELKGILNANKGPVILGWGTESFIKEKANEILENKLIVHYYCETMRIKKEACGRSRFKTPFGRFVFV